MVEEMNDKPGYTKTKLGWIPEDWKVRKLGNYIRIQSGSSPSKFIRSKTGVNFIKVDDLNNTHKYQSIGKYLVASAGTCIETNSIIFPKRGAAILNNKVRISSNPLCIDSNLMAISSVKKDLDTEYLYYFLKHRKLFKIADTSTIPQINNKHINPLQIIIPPLREQEAIADSLITWDDALLKLDQLITAKQQLKKVLMQQLLSGKKRLPGFEGDWTTWTYGELFKQVSRPVEWDDDANYDLISVRRRSGGLFYRDSLKGVEILTKKLYTVRKGDFLMSKMQILHGASGLVTEEFDDMKISGSYIAVNPRNKSILSMNYISWYSQTPKFYHQTYRSSYGVHIEKMTFNYKLFEKEEIAIPSIEEQTAISKVLNTASQEIELLKQQLNHYQQQKKGLMQQLLTGKKRLKVN